MKTEQIELEKGTAFGYTIDLPKAPLVVIRAGNGFVMCGYLNIEAANQTGVVAARVRGVRTHDDVLRAPIVEVSREATAIGITEGMTGREALEKMFDSIR
jgi:uncharacterized protein YunC (DUF1805 family)